MTITYCTTCGAALFDREVETHVCPPSWEVQIQDYDGEGEWREVRAGSLEDAAKEAVAGMDGSGYSRDGEKWWVSVRKNEGEAPKRFQVKIEYVPSYEVKESRTCRACGGEFATTAYAINKDLEEKVCSECRYKAWQAEKAAKSEASR